MTKPLGYKPGFFVYISYPSIIVMPYAKIKQEKKLVVKYEIKIKKLKNSKTTKINKIN
jgi:hypothetical protein